MKKLCILLLVLGLATAVNADYVGLTFTLEGQGHSGAQPAEITLAPSQCVELDLELLAQHNMLCYDITYTLDNAKAELITTAYGQQGPVAFPAPFDTPGGITGTPLPQYVEMSGTQNTTTPLPGAATIMQKLVLHCLAAGDVTLTVTALEGTKLDGVWITDEVLHTLIIHQIPEPMTLTLLGLGSLILVRRKK
jgi:hypothetical protein